MRTEPDLDQAGLIDLLGDRYRLEVTRLTFVPFGIDSWSYVATCADGSRAFVKLPRNPTSARSDARLLAALAARDIPVPRPLADRGGGFVSRFDGYEVQVFEYLEGRDLESETAWPADLYAAVADLVAAIHQSTPAVRHLVDRHERYELPFLPHFVLTLTAVEDDADLPAGDDPTLAALRQALGTASPGLRAAVDRLETLRDLAAAGDADLVLCHTDIWGSNLLRSDDGTLHLLDWSDALLGPREADLFMFAGTDFFPAERFGRFRDRYESACGPVRLNAETFGFYFYRRTLEDLASFVGWIAEGNTEAMAPAAMLTVVLDNLAELPRLEDHIRRVSGVLNAARPRSTG